MYLTTTQKYLSQYAEKVSIEASSKFIVNKNYAHTLVIPMCDELSNYQRLINNIQTLYFNAPLLVIFVINHHENTPNEVVRNNKALKEFLISGYENTQLLENCFLLNVTKDIDIIIFYMCEKNALPVKQGVGLARKIGCDFVLDVITNHHLSNIKWIHSTDADVILPENYFTQLEYICPTKYSACVYNFIHYVSDDTNSEIKNAICIYERSLHQYVNGLRYANSPYAYHTIGSLIAISSHYYSIVRGFPKISGAEDFYMLNKLAKTAPVTTINNAPIKVQARLSDRVPFGTGPALKKIIDKDNNYIKQLTYPQVYFDQLKIVIQHINQGKYHELSNHKKIYNILETLGFFNAIQKIEKNNANPTKRVQHIHHWFDAFKTLKFIRLISKI